MLVTNHGENRIIKRVGGSKKSVDKIVEKALEFGITHSESTGLLKKYITKLYFQYETGNNIRIYNRKIYIFHDDTLITVFDLPNHLYPIEDTIKSRRKK